MLLVRGPVLIYQMERREFIDALDQFFSGEDIRTVHGVKGLFAKCPIQYPNRLWSVDSLIRQKDRIYLQDCEL